MQCILVVVFDRHCKRSYSDERAATNLYKWETLFQEA